MNNSFENLSGSCPDDLIDVISDVIKQKEIIEQTSAISEWLNQYDNTNLIDKILASVIHNLISSVLSMLGFQFANSNETFSSDDVGAIVIRALEQITEQISFALESAQKEIK